MEIATAILEFLFIIVIAQGTLFLVQLTISNIRDVKEDEDVASDKDKPMKIELLFLIR